MSSLLLTDLISCKTMRASLFVLVFCIFSNSLWAGEDGREAERIVAIGDVHGDYDNFVTVLEQAGIINRRGNWQAGETHLVQLGDLADRGPDTSRIIELLMQLERQARRRGGQVHVLIGNHEAMNMLGDLRYVHPGEYEAFVDNNSAALRDRYFAAVVARQQVLQPDFEPDTAFRQEWNSQIPLGWVEHRLAWSPDGEFGRWVLEKDAVLRLNNTLFLHGGISPSVIGMSVAEINTAVRAELAAGESGQTETPGLATAEGGPLWYRGLASNDEALEADHVAAILERYEVERIVIGHTPGTGTIVPRFGGRVLVIDSGISDYYGGHLTSLTLEADRLINTQNGTQLEIPVNDADPLPYFEAVLELDPGLTALRLQSEAVETSDSPEQQISAEPVDPPAAQDPGNL